MHRFFVRLTPIHLHDTEHVPFCPKIDIQMDLSSLTVANIDLNGTKRVCYFRQDTSDQKVLDQIFKGGAYDISLIPRYAEIEGAFQAHLEAGQTPLIIDAGANIGASALFFALIFPGSLVYAIEPERSNFELLVENTKGLNVVCIQAALSEKPGRARVVDNGNGFWGFQTEASSDLEDAIPCVTVEEILERKEHENCWPFLAKIDIEGAEASLFEGHPAWLRKIPVLIVELHDWLFPAAGTSKSFIRCMSEEDRDFIPLGENVLAINHVL